MLNRLYLTVIVTGGASPGKSFQLRFVASTAVSVLPSGHVMVSVGVGTILSSASWSGIDQDGV